MKKRTIYILVSLLIIALIAAVYWKKNNSSDGKLVLAEHPQVRTIKETVSANGKIQPVKQVKISPEVPGEIIQLPVVEGQKVQVGDLLAVINPDIYEAASNRAEAALNSAKANVSNSKAMLQQAKARLINSETVYKRQKQLFDDGVISQAEMDQANADFEISKAEVEAATESLKAAEYNAKSSEASLKEARDNYKRTTLYAPMDGTVSKLGVEEGERVVGTAQMEGTEMMVVADLTQMEVNAEVNESDIVRVKIGDTADVEVDAYVNRTFKGIVTEIANSSESSTLQGSDQITVFSVKVRILSESYQDLVDTAHAHLSPFRPGMTATVDINTGTSTNVISIPIQAVTVRPDSASGVKKGREFNLANVSDDQLIECVYVIVDGKAVMKPVSIGLQDSRNMEIKSGIDTSDMVITGPYALLSKQLQEGTTVEIGDRSTVFSTEE